VLVPACAFVWPCLVDLQACRLEEGEAAVLEGGMPTFVRTGPRRVETALNLLFPTSSSPLPINFLPLDQRAPCPVFFSRVHCYCVPRASTTILLLLLQLYSNYHCTISLSLYLYHILSCSCPVPVCVLILRPFPLLECVAVLSVSRAVRVRVPLCGVASVDGPSARVAVLCTLLRCSPLCEPGLTS
jgi:hypothetical protein